ncbi:MAG: mevalonate kinase [Elusimicrobia bacterium]|nr:mevalonate kinase [Elusimicrobiota bacterium]
MRCQSADASSKLILLGEHAVVYGKTALAVPLLKPRASARVVPAPAGRPAGVDLKDLEVRWDGDARDVPPAAAPFARLIALAVERFPAVPACGWELVVRSRIPSGCGLGSGAATAAAALRAVCARFAVSCAPALLSELVYEVEKLHHGTPSGIDNTVIAMGRPILYARGAAPRFLTRPAAPCFLVVGHTGRSHRTSEVVADVARARGLNPVRHDAIFDAIGRLSGPGAEAFQAARWIDLGQLMDRNQELLKDLGVSSAELDALVGAARRAGALGAKLSGAGRGGCMAALAADAVSGQRVEKALKAAGAAETFLTEVGDHAAS